MKEGNNPELFDKKRPKKSDSGRYTDPDKVNHVIDLLHEDQGRSMSEVSRLLAVSYSTVWRIVHEDLFYKSYVLKRAQKLAPGTISSRLDRAKKLLNILKKKLGLIFFSDEKTFPVKQKVNRRNSRWLCSDADDVPVVEHGHHPESILVLGVISSEGDVMPPLFIQRGVRLNGEMYRDILSDSVIPWCREIAKDRPFTFQQDGPPPPILQKSRRTGCGKISVKVKSSGAGSNGLRAAQTSTLSITFCGASWRPRSVASHIIVSMTSRSR